MSDNHTYYLRNTVRHGQESPISNVVQAGKLPTRPTSFDYATFWLMGIPGKRTACLDIGCGTLTLLRSVESLFEKQFGIDIAAYECWSAYPSIITQVFDLDKGPLPFGDQAFDAVTMTMVLEHIFNPFHALREIWRVSKPNAQIVITVPNLASIRHRWALLRGKLPVTSACFSFEEEAWDGYHLHNFTKSSLTWLLRRDGLRPLRWASQGRLQFLKRLFPSLFGADLIVLCRKAEPEPHLPPRF